MNGNLITMDRDIRRFSKLESGGRGGVVFLRIPFRGEISLPHWGKIKEPFWGKASSEIETPFVCEFD